MHLSVICLLGHLWHHPVVFSLGLAQDEDLVLYTSAWKNTAFIRSGSCVAVTGQIGFRATQRVDGRLVLPEAMKCLAVKGA